MKKAPRIKLNRLRKNCRTFNILMVYELLVKSTPWLTNFRYALQIATGSFGPNTNHLIFWKVAANFVIALIRSRRFMKIFSCRFPSMLQKTQIICSERSVNIIWQQISPVWKSCLAITMSNNRQSTTCCLETIPHICRLHLAPTLLMQTTI